MLPLSPHAVCPPQPCERVPCILLAQTPKGRPCFHSSSFRFLALCAWPFLCGAYLVLKPRFSLTFAAARTKTAISHPAMRNVIQTTELLGNTLRLVSKAERVINYFFWLQQKFLQLLFEKTSPGWMFEFQVSALLSQLYLH